MSGALDISSFADAAEAAAIASAADALSSEDVAQRHSVVEQILLDKDVNGVACELAQISLVIYLWVG